LNLKTGSKKKSRPNSVTLNQLKEEKDGVTGFFSDLANDVERSHTKIDLLNSEDSSQNIKLDKKKVPNTLSNRKISKFISHFKKILVISVLAAGIISGTIAATFVLIYTLPLLLSSVVIISATIAGAGGIALTASLIYLIAKKRMSNN